MIISYIVCVTLGLVVGYIIWGGRRQMKHGRLIDGDALEKYLSDAEIEATRQRKYVFASALNTICGNVRNLPTIESERKKGKWIPQNHNKVNGMTSTVVYYYPKCSVCGHSAYYTNFCPNCGADMRGEGNDET